MKFHTSLNYLRWYSKKCQSLQNTFYSSRILSRHGVSRVTLVSRIATHILIINTWSMWETSFNETYFIPRNFIFLVVFSYKNPFVRFRFHPFICLVYRSKYLSLCEVIKLCWIVSFYFDQLFLRQHSLTDLGSRPSLSSIILNAIT